MTFDTASKLGYNLPAFQRGTNQEEKAGNQMVRTASAVASVVIVLAWLVFSYWPAGAAALPIISFGPNAAGWLAALAVAGLAAAAVIQGWLVYATARSLRRPANAAQAAVVQQFGLHVGGEALLTAAPLIFTLALAAWVWLS